MLSVAAFRYINILNRTNPSTVGFQFLQFSQKWHNSLAINQNQSCRLFTAKVGGINKNSNLIETDDSEEEEEKEIKIQLDPRKHFDAQFMKSRGPGGQNVNKVNTKVILRIQLGTASWMPDRVKKRLAELRPMNMQ